MSVLPAAAVEAMRTTPCFYMTVQSVADALAHTPGRIIGKAVERLGMRNLCISTGDTMVILAEQIS